MITRKDNLKTASDNFPEIGPILAGYGLHCIGCHVSAVESIEEGCMAHGLSDKDIVKLVKDANAQIKLFDSLPDLSLTKKALLNLKEKLSKSKDKYVRVFPIFGGFDFETTSDKYDNEIIVDAGIELLLNAKARRFLKGVSIDFDEKKSDFIAKRKPLKK
ncbi:MAG: DUF1858 domain-containing protein [Candidatus ainarchaeum sp.]|nr:DUF1858 domain-containing protein [Candidatus ainarchaeum sp.]